MPIKKCTFERPPAAPIFKPTIKEFEDPLSYIEKIRPVAQNYGICKIISPKQWNPPFAVDRNSFKFRPRVQRLNEVGAQSRIRTNFFRSIEAYWEHQTTPFVAPVIRGIHIDLFQLHMKVSQFGGSLQVTKNKQWTMICRELGMGEKAKVVSSHVKSSYERLIQPYLDFCDNKFMVENSILFPEDLAPVRMRGKTAMTLASPKMTRSKTQRFKKQSSGSCKTCESTENAESMVTCVECGLWFHITCLESPLSDVISPWVCSRCLQINCARELSRLDAEVFGFSQSPCKYSLETFATYAESFKQKYFHDRQNVSMKDVEEEYWRLVAAEDESEDVIVKYGADISSGLTSSGFPTKNNRHLYSESDQKYVENGWNLNNLPVLDKSIFRFVSNDISGMTVPWCYVGMVFSCFCWHIEDHWSYSINYMHTGECKTWYGVPESDAELFEDLMRKEACQLFAKSPDLLHHITTQLNPTVLIKNNVKVYRTDQAPGEFVVTFPRAYHAGFNQGFNFAEAVNFCPADWLSKGRASVESYRLVKRPSVFSHNELICKMASCVDSLDIVLLKAVYEEIVIIQQEEKAARKSICTLCQGGTCRTERLHLDQISEDDRECLHCRTTLYISGVTCTTCCQPDRMLCLDHVKEVCSCASKESLVLKYRYSLDEISAMVATVKNKLEQYNLWMTRLFHLAKSEFCSSPVSAEESRVMRNVAQFIENLGVLQEDDISVKCVDEKPNLEELRMLLQLGKKMNCPELLLDFLEAIIDTCQRAMSMTEQLLRSHRSPASDEDKENNGARDDGADRDKLSLTEMRMLVEKLRSLPAHVPQLEEAAQTLYSINEWRRRVRAAVSTGEVVEAGVLQALLGAGESNLVYLSEYRMLQRMRAHAQWAAEARALLAVDRTSLPTLAVVKAALDQGRSLLGTGEIDKIATLAEPLEQDDDEEEQQADYRASGWALVLEGAARSQKKLAADIARAEAAQKEADGILKATPGVITLAALRTLLRSADSKLTCVVVGVERLREVLADATALNETVADTWQQTQLCRRLVHIDDLQALIKRADAVCVSFTHLPELRALLKAVDVWREHLYSLFVRPGTVAGVSACSLLEVLFPRPARVFKLMIAREAVSSRLVAACKAESVVKEDEEEGDVGRRARKGRGRQKRPSSSADDPMAARHDNASLFEAFLRAPSTVEVDSFAGTYRSMCAEELEWMWNLRTLNEDKASRDRGGHDLYCFCRRKGTDQRGAQVMCDLCQDWFHLACLGLPHSFKDISSAKFLCPQCERSRRPAFEVVLAERRKLEQEARMVRVPEHVALCLMSQRVISFHKHTNQLFSPQTELGAVFAEYKRLFGVQAILPRYGGQPQPTSSSLLDNADSQQVGAALLDNGNPSTGKQSRKTPHSMFKSATGSSTAASSVATSNSGVSSQAVMPVARQPSPLPSKEAQQNIRRMKVSLSEEARRELEEIYIELCLLEVSQPTVTWIWKLYQSLVDGGGSGGGAGEDDSDDRDPVVASVFKRETGGSGGRSSGSDGDEDGDRDKLDSILRLVSKTEPKRVRRPEMEAQGDRPVKREALVAADDRKEALQKFSFKRKLAGKVVCGQSPPPKAKKPVQKTVAVGSRGAVTRKRGRGARVTPCRDPFDRPQALASEYYDDENDVILLDNVDISGGRHSKGKRRVKTVSGASGRSVASDGSGAPTSRQPHRAQRISATVARRQPSVDRTDYYSDEKCPSPDSCDQPPDPGNRLVSYGTLQKRGRKPTVPTSTGPSPGTSAALKRRRKGAAGGKRVCNDDCEADHCVQQSSDKVNWVACDLCNLWYHWPCVGIQSDGEVGERFVCPRCRDSKRRPLGGRGASPQEDEGDEGAVPEDLGADDLNVTLEEEAGLSPPPPFLQPECCLQEEVVEISYLSRSSSDCD